MMLDECGAALDPIAVIHIGDAVNVPHFGDMDVTAYRAVVNSFEEQVADYCKRKGNEIHGALFR